MMKRKIFMSNVVVLLVVVLLEAEPFDLLSKVNGAGKPLEFKFAPSRPYLYDYSGLYSNCSSSSLFLAEREMYSLISSLSPHRYTCKQRFETEASLTLILNCSQIDLYSICEYENMIVVVDGTINKRCSERIHGESWHGSIITLHYTRIYFGVKGGYICTIMARRLPEPRLTTSPSVPDIVSKEDWSSIWKNSSFTTPGITDSDRCGCGLSRTENDIQRTANPWYCVLIIERADNQTRICGGTLISANHLVTAAECLEGDIIKIDIGLGKFNLSDRNETESIWSRTNIFSVHPEYAGRTAGSREAFNVAVVHLAAPVSFTDFILPICTPRPTPFPTPDTAAKGVMWSLRRTFSTLMNTRGVQYVKTEFPLLIVDTERCSIPGTRMTSQNGSKMTSPTGARVTSHPRTSMTSHHLCAQFTDAIISHAFSGEPLTVQIGRQHFLAGLSTLHSGSPLLQPLEIYLRLAVASPWLRSFLSDEPCDLAT